MKKRNIIIIITVIAVLVIAVGILAFINAGNAEEKKMLEEEAIILIKSAGQKLGEVDMNLIRNIGLEDFSANLDTSDSEPEEHLAGRGRPDRYWCLEELRIWWSSRRIFWTQFSAEHGSPNR